MAQQVYLLDVRRVMVEDELCEEIVISWLSWIELEAHYAERLAVDQTNVRECFEGLGGVLEDFIINRGVAGVVDLHSLVDRLARATRREVNHPGWVELDHGDECLGAWRERVANEADVEAKRRINLFIHCVFIFRALHRS